MGETRKIAAILVSDVVGYSRLAGVDEDRTLSRLRGLRSDLIDPAIAAHHGRIVKRTGDGAIVEFRSVVDAVRCAIEVQNAMVERNAGVAAERRIDFRIGIHLGDVVEEADGDLMGDGVNIAARLEGIAEPGAICLSEDAYRQVKARLDLSVSDLGPIQLKNIAEQVRVYSLEVGKPAQGKPGPALASEKSAPPRLSMVVLPFANLGGGAEHEYFVDGVTESLTTDLSRIRGSFVIGRNTAFTYKGKAVDLKQIGRELNVRYVLEGSVQRGGNRIRVNVQLIDAESGHHLWAERFDKPLADLFDMQDEIVARLARTLNTELLAAEARRAEKVSSPDSVDLYFQGQAWFNKGMNPDAMKEARRFFDLALDADLGNVEALVASARVDLIEGSFFFTDRATAWTRAEAKLKKALSAAPDHPVAHMLSGFVDFYIAKRVAEGIDKCKYSLALDRNLAEANAYIGLAKTIEGRAEETESYILEALRLSPRDTLAFLWFVIAGIAKRHQGKWEEASAWMRRSIEANRNFSNSHFDLAGVLTQLGRLDDARSAVKSGLALDPNYSIARARALWAAESSDPTYLAQTERILEGLREAGVPE